MPRPRTGRGRRETLPPRLPQDSARPQRPPTLTEALRGPRVPNDTFDPTARGAGRRFFTDLNQPPDASEEEDDFFGIPLRPRITGRESDRTSRVRSARAPRRPVDCEALPPTRTSRRAPDSEGLPSIRGSRPTDCEVLPSFRTSRRAPDSEGFPSIRASRPTDCEALPSIRASRRAPDSEALPSIRATSNDNYGTRYPSKGLETLRSAGATDQTGGAPPATSAPRTKNPGQGRTSGPNKARAGEEEECDSDSGEDCGSAFSSDPEEEIYSTSDFPYRPGSILAMCLGSGDGGENKDAELYLPTNNWHSRNTAPPVHTSPEADPEVRVGVNDPLLPNPLHRRTIACDEAGAEEIDPVTKGLSMRAAGRRLPGNRDGQNQTYATRQPPCPPSAIQPRQRTGGVGAAAAATARKRVAINREHRRAAAAPPSPSRTETNAPKPGDELWPAQWPDATYVSRSEAMRHTPDSDSDYEGIHLTHTEDICSPDSSDTDWDPEDIGPSDGDWEEYSDEEPYLGDLPWWPGRTITLNLDSEAEGEDGTISGAPENRGSPAPPQTTGSSDSDGKEDSTRNPTWVTVHGGQEEPLPNPSHLQTTAYGDVRASGVNTGTAPITGNAKSPRLASGQMQPGDEDRRSWPTDAIRYPSLPATTLSHQRVSGFAQEGITITPPRRRWRNDGRMVNAPVSQPPPRRTKENWSTDVAQQNLPLPGSTGATTDGQTNGRRTDDGRTVGPLGPPLTPQTEIMATTDEGAEAPGIFVFSAAATAQEGSTPTRTTPWTMLSTEVTEEGATAAATTPERKEGTGQAGHRQQDEARETRPGGPGGRGHGHREGGPSPTDTPGSHAATRTAPGTLASPGTHTTSTAGT